MNFYVGQLFTVKRQNNISDGWRGKEVQVTSVGEYVLGLKRLQDGVTSNINIVSADRVLELTKEAYENV